MATTNLAAEETAVLRAREQSGARRTRAKLWDAIATGTLWTAAGIVVFTFLYILWTAITKGLPALGLPHFLTSGLNSVGIAPQIFYTYYLLILSLILIIPLGLGAAIYIVEYAKQGPLLNVLRFATETMTSIPSILVGFLGVLLFVTHFGTGTFMGPTPAAGALALTVLNLAWMLRTAEDALRAVPRDLREASMALGATRLRTVTRAVLPAAIPGIVTGILIVAGRIIAESAVLLYTTTPPGGNGNNWFSLNPFQPGGETLAVHAYNLFSEPGGIPNAAELRLGTALVLIVSVLAFNVTARVIGAVVNRRFTGR
jgi:phosphate transport system permease protein